MCSNRCRFCAQVGIATSAEPSREELIAAVDAAAGEEITFTGGEPTLHGDLLTLVARARARGFRRVGVQSNGSGLADSDLAVELARAGLSDVHLSIHGAKPAPHDYHTGIAGSFTAILAALARCRAAGLTVVVTTLLTRSNFRVVSELPDLLRRRGVAAWQLALPRAHGAAATEFDRMLPRLGLALPFALHAVESSRELGLPAWLRGAPLCALGRFASEVIVDEPRAYGDMCAPCAARSMCCGVDATYLRRFDGDELSALTLAPVGSAQPVELQRLFVAIGELGPTRDPAATAVAPRRRRAGLDKLAKARPASTREDDD